MHSSPPSLTAPAWGSRSADRSSNRTAADCGPPPTPGRAQPSTLPCPAKSTRIKNLRRCSTAERAIQPLRATSEIDPPGTEVALLSDGGFMARLDRRGRAALDQLVPVVYSELRRLAKRHLIRQSPGQPLQTTDLVSEAYLKLAHLQGMDWE